MVFFRFLISVVNKEPIEPLSRPNQGMQSSVAVYQRRSSLCPWVLRLSLIQGAPWPLRASLGEPFGPGLSCILGPILGTYGVQSNVITKICNNGPFLVSLLSTKRETPMSCKEDDNIKRRGATPLGAPSIPPGAPAKGTCWQKYGLSSL